MTDSKQPRFLTFLGGDRSPTVPTGDGKTSRVLSRGESVELTPAFLAEVGDDWPARALAQPDRWAAGTLEDLPDLRESLEREAEEEIIAHPARNAARLTRELGLSRIEAQRQAIAEHRALLARQSFVQTSTVGSR